MRGYLLDLKKKKKKKLIKLNFGKQALSGMLKVNDINFIKVL
jgi:hypothetical protein